MIQSDSQAPGAAAKSRPVIHPEECKGCGRCVVACPKKVLRFRAGLNSRGNRVVEYAGEGCVGCGSCFYNCPEPYALDVIIPEKPAAAKPAPAKP